MTVSAPLPHLPLTAALTRPDPLSATARSTLLTGALLAHLLGAWALLQVPAVRQVAREVAPIQVDLIAPQLQAPSPSLPPPRPQPFAPPSTTSPKSSPTTPPTTPVLATQSLPMPSTQPVLSAPPPPPELPAAPSPSALPIQPAALAAPAPITPSAQAAPPTPPAAPAPAPAAPRAVVIGDTDWVRAPQLDYPLASKRLREEGVVQVRALIDARGVPRRVVLHRSSGFPRLDQEALDKALSARLKPRTENGQPVEFWALMPFGFELEN